MIPNSESLDSQGSITTNREDTDQVRSKGQQKEYQQMVIRGAQKDKQEIGTTSQGPEISCVYLVRNRDSKYYAKIRVILSTQRQQSSTEQTAC
eukprot:3496241-Rhodomonas_salina.1